MLISDEPPVSTLSTEESTANLTLLLASTLVDHFNPVDFGQQLMDSTLRASALANLSYNCEEVQFNGAYHWSLKADTRRDLLKEHYNSELFKSVLQSIEFEPYDHFALYLQKGLNGQDLTLEAHKARDSRALLRAARLVEQLGISSDIQKEGDKNSGATLKTSDSRIIRQSIARTAAMDALDNTAGGRLYGRYREFRELIKYRNTDLSDQAQGPLKLFVIIGVGGVGKSALVSRYVAWQRNRPRAAPVVHFDFDRSSLSPNDPLALTLELTRQLGLFEHGLDLPLSNFRRIQRDHNPGTISHEMSNRAMFAALSDLRAVFAKWPRRKSAVTLVIDTFEEVALRGQLAVEQVLNWLTDLRNITQLDNLHVIISGREMPDALLSDHNTHICHRIRLNDLQANSAELLLRSAGIDSEVARRTVDTFGGNPLVLRMFIRFSENNPEEVHALLSDGRNQKRSAPGGKLALTFLFERILVRITDDQVRKLTSPGLLLRHITADLIQNVLAVPCELGSLTNEQAKALFDSLAGHVWLVRQEGNRLLSHRRDLRRLMLPGIQKHYPEKFDEINRRAVSYYESNPARIPASDAWLEAAYHRGFLPDTPVYRDRDQARQIITKLGADLLDWPVHSSALIKHAAQLSERLTEDEIASLSQRQGITSRALRAAQLLDEGHEAESAEELAHVEQAVNPASGGRHAWVQEFPLPPDQYQDEMSDEQQRALNAVSIRLAFHQGRFERISELATNALKPLFRTRDALATTHYWQDNKLLNKLPWYVALSVLAEPEAGSEADTIIPVSALDAVQATPRRVGIDSTFELFYMLAIASVMNDTRAVESLSSFLRSSLPCFSPPINNPAQLQILQLSVKALTSGDLIGQRDIVTVENCDCLRYGTLEMPLCESHPDTANNRQRLGLVRQAQEVVAERRPTLRELDELRTHMRQHKVDVLGPAGLDLLQSRQDAMYPPIRFALESVSVSTLRTVLMELSQLSPYWPIELTPSEAASHAAYSYGRVELGAIIETADRCNLLITLLELTADKVRDPLLRDEVRLITRLENRLTG